MKNKSNIIFVVICILLMITILSTVSYSVRNFFEVYNMSLNSFPKSYLKNTIFSIDTYISFFTIFDILNGISWIIILYFLFNFIIRNYGILKYQSTYHQSETYGSDGTSRWQTIGEVKKYYGEDKLGWFLGTLESSNVKLDNGKEKRKKKKDLIYKLGMDASYHSAKGELNMQVIVLGSPGSKKSTGFIYPNIFHIPYIYMNTNERPDLIITDPKSELCSFSFNYLEKQGYDVHVLDFIHLKYGDSINSIDFITSDKELMEVADGYIRSVEAASGSNPKDAFWGEQEGQALGALLGAVQQTKPKNEANFFGALKLLTNELTNNVGAIDIEKAMNYFKDNNIEGAPLQLWKNFIMLTKSETTSSNILGGLAGKLKLFAIDGIQNITNTTTFDIRKLGAKKELGEKPIALFVFMPDSDRTFSPIINVTITTIMKQLYKTAYKYDNKLYNPVYFLLEEMANIGKISGLVEMLGTMRSRRIYPMMIWQSLAQLKQRYPDSWEDIIANCDTQVYLGINDDFTAQYCSKVLGKTTIQTQGISRTAEGIFGENKTSESNNYKSRPLLFPDECKRFDNNKLIISQRSRFPVILNKVQYKYWNEYIEHLICQPKNIFELPLMNKKHVKELIIDKNRIRDTENKKHVKELIIDKNQINDITNKNTVIDITHNNIDFVEDTNIGNSSTESIKKINTENEVKHTGIDSSCEIDNTNMFYDLSKQFNKER